MFQLEIVRDETPGPGKVVLTYLNGHLMQMDGVTPEEWLLGELLPPWTGS